MNKSIICTQCGKEISYNVYLENPLCTFCGATYIEMQDPAKSEANLVAGKCTECGANLKVNATEDASVCTFCNNAFVTQKAIIHYSSALDINECLKNGEDLLNLKAFTKACIAFKSAIDVDSSDYRAYLGLLRAETEDFTSTTNETYLDLLQKTLSLCPAKEVNTIKNKSKYYIEKRNELKDLHEQVVNPLKSKLNNIILIGSIIIGLILISCIVLVVLNSIFNFTSNILLWWLTILASLLASLTFIFFARFWNTNLKTHYQEIERIENEIKELKEVE